MDEDFGKVIDRVIRDSKEVGVMHLVEKLARLDVANGVQLLNDLANGSKEAMDKVLGASYDD